MRSNLVVQIQRYDLFDVIRKPRGDLQAIARSLG